jgi:hypothetical protein
VNVQRIIVAYDTRDAELKQRREQREKERAGEEPPAAGEGSAGT